MTCNFVYVCILGLQLLTTTIATVSPEVELTLLHEESPVGYLITFEFTFEKYDEFYRCLCEEGAIECLAAYHKNTRPPYIVRDTKCSRTVTDTRTFFNYFHCKNDAILASINCTRLQQQQFACNESKAFTTISSTSKVPCKVDCLGLFWYDPSKENLKYDSVTQQKTSCQPHCYGQIYTTTSATKRTQTTTQTSSRTTTNARKTTTAGQTQTQTTTTITPKADWEWEQRTNNNENYTLVIVCIDAILFIAILIVAALFISWWRRRRYDKTARKCVKYRTQRRPHITQPSRENGKYLEIDVETTPSCIPKSVNLIRTNSTTATDNLDGVHPSGGASASTVSAYANATAIDDIGYVEIIDIEEEKSPKRCPGHSKLETAAKNGVNPSDEALASTLSVDANATAKDDSGYIELFDTEDDGAGHSKLETNTKNGVNPSLGESASTLSEDANATIINDLGYLEITDVEEEESPKRGAGRSKLETAAKKLTNYRLSLGKSRDNSNLNSSSLLNGHPDVENVYDTIDEETPASTSSTDAHVIALVSEKEGASKPDDVHSNTDANTKEYPEYINFIRKPGQDSNSKPCSLSPEVPDVEFADDDFHDASETDHTYFDTNGKEYPKYVNSLGTLFQDSNL